MNLRAALGSAFPILVALAVACDDAGFPVGPGEGPTSAPSPPRLAWSQAAPSPSAVEGYTFLLFVDGVQTTVSAPTCAGPHLDGNFECSVLLPTLAAGRRILEIVTVDALTGLRSTRSAPLSIDVGAAGRPLTFVTGDAGSAAATSQSDLTIPSTICAAGPAAPCFSVATLASDIAPARRLLPLPDGRLLVLHEDGAVTFLPSGISELPLRGRDGRGDLVQMADVAADPDFDRNQLLYFAIVTIAPDGRRAASVVRGREVADRIGEWATVVADIPVGHTGSPHISIGPDRRMYLALPGQAADSTGYSGSVVRFSRDGTAAGYVPTGSPVLAQGPTVPAGLAWDAASRLLIASMTTAGEPSLALVPVDRTAALPQVQPIGGSSPFRGLRDVTAPTRSEAGTGATIAILDGNPPALWIASLTAGQSPLVASKALIPLGVLVPEAVASAPNGDLLVAVREPQGVRDAVLRLRQR